MGFKRVSMGFPLDSYRNSMIFQWDFFGFLWEFHDVFMNFYGITMGCLRDSYCMLFPCYAYDMSMGFLWDSSGISMIFL